MSVQVCVHVLVCVYVHACVCAPVSVCLSASVGMCVRASMRAGAALSFSDLGLTADRHDLTPRDVEAKEPGTWGAGRRGLPSVSSRVRETTITI